MTAINPNVRFRVLSPELPPSLLDEEMLARWSAENARWLADEARRGREEFVFFEGPPTANGRPGIHHVFSRTLKDLFCRYRVMKGFHVTRKAGWDTHGLPVEIEVEKQLGISSKQQIEELGVERFNRLCRESVWRYREDWERLSSRMGYWLDYEHAYITYSNEYVESVWWALKTLYERELLYRGHKILPYCPRCGTALSSHEVAQGYEDVRGPSVFVTFPLRDVGRDGIAARRILVWTTTPWTLVSNVALAVNPELEYLELRRRPEGDGTLILAERRAQVVLGDDFTDRWEIVARMVGSDLAGLRYVRPLDWVRLEGGERELIIAEDFVSAEDGSGVVHMAPAFGADDYLAGQRHGLAFVQPVDQRGQFPPDLPVVGGRFVKEADPLIIEELERRGALFRAGTIEHSYPHCWRCRTPLLYYARGSWFVRTTAFRDNMLARNARVNWTPPATGEGRFGEWLKNNIDWALSRDRYWGTPLPLWVCDREASHVDAIGSYAELAHRWGQPLPSDFDPHKPYIDRYEWPCGSCSGRMRRVPEVIDAWFDSGSMPFAQWHYPFERRDVVERQYPADFIAEGVDQTRGWFYSLLAIAAGLGDHLPNNELVDHGFTAPYRAVVVNDNVLDADGQKMSKSRGNVVDPSAVLSRHGADAVRLFLVASSQVFVPRRFDEEAIRELSGRFLLTLKNVYSGIFAQYANFGWESSPLDPAPAERPAVDRWVLSRLATAERDTNAALAAYDATAAARAVMDFVVNDVSNWYVRLNRARFYDVETADNRSAFATLHEVLVVSCRLLAPFCPFVSDWLHRELTGKSVHLAPFTRDDDIGDGDGWAIGSGRHSRPPADPSLERGMASIRTLVTLGRAARDESDLRVRQPLSRLVCVVPEGERAGVEPLVSLLRSELNVKQVEFASTGDALVRLEAKPSYRSLGRRFGKSTPLAARAILALGEEALAAFERGEPVAISVNGESHELAPDDLAVLRRAAGGLVVKEESGYFAALDPTLTPELKQEGLARELISRIQRMRKDAGFVVSDRIRLHLWGGSGVASLVRVHRDYIAAEVLASEVIFGDPAGPTEVTQTFDLDEETRVGVAITRID